MSEKLIPIFDSNDNYIKSVYPRYAIQSVLKGKAIWFKNNTAIRQTANSSLVISKDIDVITKVFLNIGERLTVKEAMSKLVSIFNNDTFARYKAAGALGGAAHSGFIRLQADGQWERTR